MRYPTPYAQRYSGSGIAGQVLSYALVQVGSGAVFGDADTLTLNGITYEADTANDGVGGGNIDLGIAPADTAEQVRDKVVAAIEANDPEVIAFAHPVFLDLFIVRHLVPGDALAPAEVGAGFTIQTYVAGTAGTPVQPAIIGEQRAIRHGPELLPDG